VHPQRLLVAENVKHAAPTTKDSKPLLTSKTHFMPSLPRKLRAKKLRLNLRSQISSHGLACLDSRSGRKALMGWLPADAGQSADSARRQSGDDRAHELIRKHTKIPQRLRPAVSHLPHLLSPQQNPPSPSQKLLSKIKQTPKTTRYPQTDTSQSEYR
jgi:hypothetical protein